MVDDELAAVLEEIAARFLAARSFEHVILFDRLPGKLAALFA
jgi:hypothetical protein